MEADVQRLRTSLKILTDGLDSTNRILDDYGNRLDESSKWLVKQRERFKNKRVNIEVLRSDLYDLEKDLGGIKE